MGPVFSGRGARRDGASDWFLEVVVYNIAVFGRPLDLDMILVSCRDH